MGNPQLPKQDLTVPEIYNCFILLYINCTCRWFQNICLFNKCFVSMCDYLKKNTEAAVPGEASELGLPGSNYRSHSYSHWGSMNSCCPFTQQTGGTLFSCFHVFLILRHPSPPIPRSALPQPLYIS